jgi:hypothetical protein
VVVPFTISLGYGSIVGNMQFSQTLLVNSGQFSGTATIVSGTGRYAGSASQGVTSSGTTSGAVLSGGSLNFSLTGTLTDDGASPSA